MTFKQNKYYTSMYYISVHNTHIDFTFYILFAERGQNQLYRHQI